ncbi:hypothetical protein [Ectothiorhodospira shaposhnikovii]|uniref:hypothetical protein n=1 Tax=Ectothiorhodospira shaposhnikovii TaxID=1054 RepID=UPI001EE90394|nr:hypothetical protein [Ectothiorhodospira shaposhnikovii]MCG5512537.1 hypothetical protein [Ectothiorhodospira shaposhnikovii]
MERVKQFKAPKQSLGELKPDQVASLIAAAADVSLVLDDAGVIQDLAFGSDELSMEGYGQWLGKPWVDTVTLDGRVWSVVGQALGRYRHPG